MSLTDIDLLARAMGLAGPEQVFPWQADLLTRFRREAIPAALDIPTGLGKTSVMAIWLVARAFGAALPRRLVYVVDRRAVVDQATDVALALRKALDHDFNLRGMKSAIGLGENQALPISTLRGQFVDNREWLDDPAAPAIVVGTVDMVGSRVLFEGYGVSSKMRPYHAGLLGADTLVVLDEAHLVPPFEYLLRAVATDSAYRPREKQRDKVVPPFRLLALSATGRTRSDDVVELTENDLAHGIARQRLKATKQLRIEPLDKEMKLDESLAKWAWTVTDEGRKVARVIVYSSSREVARRAKEVLEKRARGDKKEGTPAVDLDTELFVGGRRVFEREQVKQRLESLGFIAGSGVARSRPVFLFATSAGEVGVDLDADHMVCDLVTWERMVQRLGRVNRRGEGEASIVVVAEPEPTNVDELLAKNAEERTATERNAVEKVHRMRAARHVFGRLPKNSDGAVDVSPDTLYALRKHSLSDAELRRLVDDATSPEPLRPALTRPLIEAWAMTSLKKHTGRPAIEPWLRGWIEDDQPQTAVLWRTHLPVRAEAGQPRKKEIEGFFEAAPPHTSEILQTETFRVVRWMSARAETLSKARAERHTDAEPRLHKHETVAFVLDPDGGLRKTFTVAELRSGDKTAKKALEEVLAGATLVFDARLAGLKDGLLDDKEDAVPRTADDGQHWLDEGLVGFRVRSVAAAEVTREKNWRERFRLASTVTEDEEAAGWLIVEKWCRDAATEEDRAVGAPQLVDDHQACAEDRARSLARTVGLDEQLTNVLALAARLHDEGKRAETWQRAFHAPRDGEYAKTDGPVNHRLLDGYRHELGSLLRVEHDERVRQLSGEDRDLVLHLIAAHHGFARPVIGTNGCEDGPPSVIEEKAAEIALRFARLQAVWGPWGLAWWEALLRAADQQASRDNDARYDAGEGS